MVELISHLLLQQRGSKSLLVTKKIRIPVCQTIVSDMYIAINVRLLFYYR